MHLLCALWFFVAFYDIDHSIEHIAGVNNCAADMLSRNNMSEFFLSYPQVSRLPALLPLPLRQILNPQGPDWTSPTFGRLFRSTINMGQPRITYATGQHSYISFCSSIHRHPLPTLESTLLLFVSHLAKCSLSYSTIKVYLSAVRHLHVTYGKHKEFSDQLTPRLHQVMKGIKKAQLALREPKVRQPITLDIMTKIKSTIAR